VIRRQLQTRVAAGSPCPAKRGPLNGHDTAKRMHSSILMMEQASSRASSSQPTASRDQLKHLFLCSAIPMIGFGFMDNFIMIQAGSYIDATLGAKLGMSTLMAAALGQVFSDLSGVLFGGVVERSMLTLGLTSSPTIPLTAIQRALPIVKNVSMAGSAGGVVLGCLLGASTLLFQSSETREGQVQAAHLSVTAMDTAHEMVQHHMLENIISVYLMPVNKLKMKGDEDADETVRYVARQGVSVIEESYVTSSETLYAPLKTKDGTVVAIMVCAKSEGNGFDEHEVKMTELLSKQVELVLDRIQ
jgi:hypothetical protein